MFSFSSLAVVALASFGAGPNAREINLHIYHESRGNDWAIGDHKLAHKAYGPLQIRQLVCDDVNQAYGTKYRAKQCLGNRALSIEIARKYWLLYATREQLGREPTSIDRAGIWNGGPKGYRRTATLKYRQDFAKLARER